MSRAPSPRPEGRLTWFDSEGNRIPDPNEPKDVSLEDVADLALGEVYVRLKDPDSAKTLPGTHLLQLALFGAKLKQEKEKPIEEVSMDALSIIENSDLPSERKQEIIERERKALRARLSKLDELEGT